MLYKMYEKAKQTAFKLDFYDQSIEQARIKAQKYKDKIGEISLQMYNIESRGK